MRTPYRRARRSHDRFFATFHSFIPLLLLSGKLQNGRKIHPEALWHRTSGFLFQKADPQNQIMMVGFAPRGRTRNEWACPKRVVQRKRVPLFLWKKNRPLLLLLSVQTPRGACCCRANVSRLGGRASLEAIPIGRDKAKSRWFSKSKSICAGGSGQYLDFALYGRHSAAG